MFNNDYNNKLKLQSKKNSPNSFRRKLDFVMGLVMEEEVRLRLRQTHGVVRLRVTTSKSGRVRGVLHGWVRFKKRTIMWEWNWCFLAPWNLVLFGNTQETRYV